MSSSNRWEAQEMLPDDIMYLIMAKLIMVYSPIYLARFAAVCKRWHRLVCNSWPKLVKEYDQVNTTPLVLVPVADRKNVSCRIYNLMVMGECTPAPINSLLRGSYYRHQIISSSFEWVIVEEENFRSRSASLFNPLMSKSYIRLPPLTDVRSSTVLMKGVLSKPPRSVEEDEHFDIAITMSPGFRRTCRIATRIAFLHVKKIGELESLRWVYYDYDGGDGVLDVNSIGRKICILHCNGMISCCKCSADDGFSYYYGVTKEWNSSSVLSCDYCATVYLVESSSSEPLVVFRYMDGRSSGKFTAGFKILTLTSNGGINDEEINEFNKTWNWTEEKANAVNMMETAQLQQHLDVLNWTEIKTLGNDVIFVSENSDSICIQVIGSKLRHPASGFIYFPDEYNFQESVFGVFNVIQNCLTYFFHPFDDTKLLGRPPIWLIPSYVDILKFSSIG